jgi:hypothetical protein
MHQMIHSGMVGAAGSFVYFASERPSLQRVSMRIATDDRGRVFVLTDHEEKYI